MRSAGVNGTTLAYVDEGPSDGLPIIFSHSLFFNHRMFDPLRERFVGKGFRVIAYDHRNQGDSAPAPRGELDMDTLTADVVALIGHLGLGKCHFVGNSLGGFIALRLAARHPGLLLSATALGSSAEQEHKLAEFGPLVDQLTENGPDQLLDALMYIMFGDTSLERRAELCAPWRAFMSRLSPAIGDSAYGVIHRSRIIGELSGCRVPVLAIAGSEDHAYPQPISGENIAAASGGTQVTIDNAGHSVSLEQPAIVAGLLERHFAESAVALS